MRVFTGREVDGHDPAFAVGSFAVIHLASARPLLNLQTVPGSDANGHHRSEVAGRLTALRLAAWRRGRMLGVDSSQPSPVKGVSRAGAIAKVNSRVPRRTHSPGQERVLQAGRFEVAKPGVPALTGDQSCRSRLFG